MAFIFKSTFASLSSVLHRFRSVTILKSCLVKNLWNLKHTAVSVLSASCSTLSHAYLAKIYEQIKNGSENNVQFEPYLPLCVYTQNTSFQARTEKGLGCSYKPLPSSLVFCFLAYKDDFQQTVWVYVFYHIHLLHIYMYVYICLLLWEQTMTWNCSRSFQFLRFTHLDFRWNLCWSLYLLAKTGLEWLLL
jgi:hypothetical protein